MKFIPDAVYDTIFDIDYAKLYAEGVRIILSDLDNTLATYAEDEPSEKVKAWSQNLQQIGFTLYLISNNKSKRIITYANALKVKGYLASATKPFTYRFKRFAKRENIDLSKVIMIGDQILTDVSFAKKLGIKIFIVKTLDRTTEKWYTRLNRKREKRILRKVKMKNPIIYQEMLAKGIIHE